MIIATLFFLALLVGLVGSILYLPDTASHAQVYLLAGLFASITGLAIFVVYLKIANQKIKEDYHGE